MVPAHNKCHDGWTREYYGFVMAADSSHRKGDYICMDRDMKTLPGHATNQDSHLK